MSRANQHHSGHADVASQLEEATDLLLAVTNVLGHIGVFVVDLGVGVIDDFAEARIVLDLLGHGLDLGRVLHLDAEGARQGVLTVQSGKRRVGVAGDGGAVLLQRVLLAHELNVFDVVHALELILVILDVLIGSVVGDVSLDGHLVLDVADRGVHQHGADDEQADDEQRQEDGDDGAEGRRPVAEEVAESLFDGIAEIRRRHSCRSLPSPGRG